MAVSRFPSRVRIITSRHVWLAGLGLVAVGGRQARAARSRVMVGIEDLKTRACGLAEVVRGGVQGAEPGVVKFSADVEARLAPVLDKLGLGKRVRPARKATSGARSQARARSRAQAASPRARRR
jgi:hypothetical protein